MSRLRRRRDPRRGATAPEYALGIALILVASLGAINSLQNDAGDHVRTRGALLGAPDLPDAGVSTTTATTSVTPPPPATTTTTIPPVPAQASIVSSTNGGNTGNGPWDPSVTVRITNESSGANLANATVVVTWTLHFADGTTTTETQTKTTTSTGQITFQLTNLNGTPNSSQYVASVDFLVTTVTSTNPPMTYTPASPVTVTLTDP